jgi:hypothetical protein
MRAIAATTLQLNCSASSAISMKIVLRAMAGVYHVEWSYILSSKNFTSNSRFLQVGICT